jgi:hypothetical protein
MVLTWEDSRRQSTKAGHVSLICAAGRPYLQAGRPVGPTCWPLLAVPVLHRLKDQIYVVLLSWFDPRVRDA